MYIIILANQNQTDEIKEQLDLSPNIVPVDLRTSIDDKFPDTDYDSKSEFYEEKIKDDPTYFVDHFIRRVIYRIEDWGEQTLKAEERAGKQVSSTIPDYDFVVFSIKTPEELHYLKREVSDEVRVIATEEQAAVFDYEPDYTINFHDAESISKTLREIIDEESRGE